MSLRRNTLLISSVVAPMFFTALIIRRNDKPWAITSMLHSHEVWSRSSTEKPSGNSTKFICIEFLSSLLSTRVIQQWNIQGERLLLRQIKSPLEKCSPRAMHKVLDNVNCPTSAIKENQMFNEMQYLGYNTKTSDLQRQYLVRTVLPKQNSTTFRGHKIYLQAHDLAMNKQSGY